MLKILKLQKMPKIYKNAFFIFLFVFSVQNIFCVPSYSDYACVFSSNFIELSAGLSHKTFNPTTSNTNTVRICQNALRTNFGISNTKQIKEKVLEIKKNGDSAIFRHLQGFLKKYPTLTVEQIAQKECLTVLQTSQLYFVSSFSSIVGEKALDAWENARLIALYRFSLGAKLISEQEALNAIKPFVDALKKDCASWEDFWARFFIGRQFNGLEQLKYQNYLSTSRQAYQQSQKKINFEEFLFTPTQIAKNSAVKMEEIGYRPTGNAKNFEQAQKLIQGHHIFSERDRTSIEKLKKDFSNLPCVLHLELSVDFATKAYRKAINNAQNIDNILKECGANGENNDFYNEIFYLYAESALALQKCDRANYAISQIAEEEKKTGKFLELQGRILRNSIGTSPDYDENLEMRKKAAENFKLAQKKGIKLNAETQEWLKITLGEK